MTKDQVEKLKKLEVYKQRVMLDLEKPTPKKHLLHPQTFKDYLNKELSQTVKKMEEIKHG